MLTRSLYLAAGWFALSLLLTLLFTTRLRRRNILISYFVLIFVLLAGDVWAYLTFGLPQEILIMSAFALGLGTISMLWMRDWNAFGQATWTTTLLVTALFVAYSFRVTAFTPLNALSFLFAFLFFFIEAAALLLALTHTYESLDATSRVRWHRRIDHFQPVPGYTPMVSLHVPAYNEPADVVRKTLQSLAQLDYPNYEVLVVDNNTPDSENWAKLEKICSDLGFRFRFMHLDKWPGFKSGALNFALSQTHPDAEIIGSIDADYILEPNFLSELVPAFADPKVAFIQTPQDYRDYKGDPFTESTYHGYKYFFEVSMPSRNEYNAIIFAGTMGLIRKSVLQEIGGWDEWCITEDAEASLRILKRGYKSHYLKKTFGRGLMPFTFDGLKKQRFRWCFGGIQILKKHWESLMPWAHWIDPNNKLTVAQRYFYLIGGLQWFTDVLNLIFAFFLILGAIFSLTTREYTIRPLTSPLLIMPAVFLALNMIRFVWVLGRTLRLSLPVAIRSMYNFFSMGWAVTLATIQGLIQKEGVFLRTPKAKSKSKLLRALFTAQWETLIGLACLTAGILAFIGRPDVRTFSLMALLAWQSSLYFAAPYYSLLSVQTSAGHRDVYAGKPVVENWAARWALVVILGVILGAGIVQILPQPQEVPQYARFRPSDINPGRLFGFDRVPIEARDDTPTPTLSPTPTLTPTATMPDTVVPTFTPSVTPSETVPVITPATGTASPTASLEPSLEPSFTPTTLVSPTATTPAVTATITPTLPADTPTPTLEASPTPTATLPLEPTATISVTVTPIPPQANSGTGGSAAGGITFLGGSRPLARTFSLFEVGRYAEMAQAVPLHASPAGMLLDWSLPAPDQRSWGIYSIFFLLLAFLVIYPN